MKLAVMQPYLFPYIGYYQLVKSVDKFVLYDDVNFIKSGYINRNNILVSGKSTMFTLPVPGSSSNKYISELNYDKNVRKVIKTIEQSYSKAPYFSAVFPLIEKVLTYDDRSITTISGMSINLVFEYLGLNKSFYISSELSNDKSKTAKDRLIEMAGLLECNEYINSPGGRSLYDKNYFIQRGIKLGFIDCKVKKYDQNTNGFVPNLSMIDVLMWNSVPEILILLNMYEVN
ncbi:WbqC family protein [Vibrio cyclitrophicus]|uniref:WbqC family protein n=1 Tax=Vibrio cyclitrophicus TaxID=47951 RepID=UPI0032E3DEDD